MPGTDADPAGGTETELAFSVPHERASAVASQLKRAGARTRSIESRYVDTADRRLATAGMSLRLRKVGRRWEQTLKASPGGRFERLEHTVPRDDASGSDGPQIDPRLHEGTDAGRALAKALGDADAASALVPSHASFVRRQSVTIHAEGAEVELAFDRGEIRSGEQVLPVSEIELELKRGDAAGLIALARQTVHEHRLWLLDESKSARGDRLRHGDDVVGPRAQKCKPPRIDRSMQAHPRLQAIVASTLGPMMANAGALAGGDRSDEVVHQLRVAIRRFRTVSRELGWLSAAFDGEWEAPLVDAFRTLGAWRDRETVAATLAAALAEAGSPVPVLRPPPTAVADPIAVARSPRFQGALLDVLAFTVSGAGPAERMPPDAGDARLAKRLDRLHRELGVAAKAFHALDEPERHRIRKRLKRLRYLAEAIAPLHKRSRVERFLDRLEPAQDALGRHVDLVVGLEMAEAAAAGGDDAAWFNVGWIRAALPKSVKRCAKALRSAAAAKPFWGG